MSNTFLNNALLGRYRGWNDKHNCWLGRWVADERMKTFLYSMQAFKFLNLQQFLSDSTPSYAPDVFSEGTKLIDNFLAEAEVDIVKADKRFPAGAYHFIDDVKWTKTIQQLYIALKYVQTADVDLIQFYSLWIEAIVPAITENLPQSIARKRFEIEQALTWRDPNSSMSSSIDPDSEGARIELPDVGRTSAADIDTPQTEIWLPSLSLSSSH